VSVLQVCRLPRDFGNNSGVIRGIRSSMLTADER
jgi:hypothetical protein